MMALKIGDLTELLLELTCTKCHKLLTVFPIYSSLDGSVCGRCENSMKNMTNSNSIRNTVYEAVAKHLIFPCANKVFGCRFNLKHDEVESHENVCKHRVRACPFNVNTTNCAFQCESPDAITCLPTHLRGYHSSMVVTNPHILTLTTDETNVKVNFMEIDPETAFIVLSRYDKGTNKFHCIVMCGSDGPAHKNYAYKLELGKGDKYFLNLSKDQTEQLQESSEALKNCNRMITVDIASAANLFGNLDYDLQCRISICKKDSQQLDLALELNKQILEELECPVCKNCMRTQIFNCSGGHSLCQECKLQILTCPTCRVPMGNTRNFVLEKLAQKLSYPCKYSHFGCTEVLPVPGIDEHEVQCNRICPMTTLPAGCNFQGKLLNLVDHINEYHANILLLENFLYQLKLDDTDHYSYYITIFNDDIFILCFKFVSQALKYNILHLGMKNNQPQYKCTLTFVNQDEKGMSFSVNQLCKVIPLPLDTSYSFKKCLKIPSDMLEPYTSLEDEEEEEKEEDADEKKVLLLKVNIKKI